MAFAISSCDGSTGSSANSSAADTRGGGTKPNTTGGSRSVQAGGSAGSSNSSKLAVSTFGGSQSTKRQSASNAGNVGSSGVITEATGGVASGGATHGGTTLTHADTSGGVAAGGKPVSGGAASGGATVGESSPTGGTAMGGSDAANTSGGDPCSSTTPVSVGTPHCDQNQSGSYGSYEWKLWSNRTTGCITTFDGSGNAFSAAWNDSGDFLAGVGPRFDGTQTAQELGTFSADFGETKDGTAGPYSYIGVYGLTVDPMVEFYIVEDFFDSPPPNLMGEKLGELDVDGGRYDVYVAQVSGTTIWHRVFGIRRTARRCGHVSISEHFSSHLPLPAPGTRFGQGRTYARRGSRRPKPTKTSLRSLAKSRADCAGRHQCARHCQRVLEPPTRTTVHAADLERKYGGISNAATAYASCCSNCPREPCGRQRTESAPSNGSAASGSGGLTPSMDWNCRLTGPHVVREFPTLEQFDPP